MGKGDHTSTQMPWGTTIIHNEDHEKTGWVDDKGDIHKPGDTGGIFGNPKTIGHVNPESVAQNMHAVLYKQKQSVTIQLPASKDIFSDYSTTNKVRKDSIYPKKL